MPTAVITGATRGLGREIALALATRHWSLVVDARSEASLAAVARELTDAGAVAVAALPGSVADADHRAAIASAVEGRGELQLLVNNASLLGPSPLPTLAEHPIDVLERVYAVNLVAPIALTQALLPLLTRSAGRVLNISSDAAVEPYDHWGGYGSSKAGLDHATAILAAERPDLRVYALDPGDMRTQMHQEAFPGEDISDRPLPVSVVPAVLALVDEDLPSGRYRASDLLADRPAPTRSADTEEVA
jgi:NAD(P)-dependent dehydrogenase (short-subunit alcohol dehydrogenase family)